MHWKVLAVYFLKTRDPKGLECFVSFCKRTVKRGDGAQERTRTSTPLRELHPECSASANSATWAQGYFGKRRLGAQDQVFSSKAYGHVIGLCEVLSSNAGDTIVIVGSKVTLSRCRPPTNALTRPFRAPLSRRERGRG